MTILCPKCNEELELPSDAVGRKIQCAYCNEKFYATEEFVRKQQKEQNHITLRLKPCLNKNMLVKKQELPPIYIKRSRELSKEEEIRRRAENGDARAQYEWAVMLMYGKGVGKNEIESLKWLRKAANQGDLNALHDMGVAYFNGLGVAVDKAESARWFRLAAERGNEHAQYALAICLFKGIGVEKDMEQALIWFKKAAERGHADAMYNVGICYGNGYGIQKDVDEAMKWFRRAADAGSEDAKKVVCPEIYTGSDAIDMFHNVWSAKRKGAAAQKEGKTTNARKQNSRSQSGRSQNSRSQRIPKLNARGYRGRVALYPATSSSTLEDWYELIVKKLLLGRVYGTKAQIGWGIIWVAIGLGGYYLTESSWWMWAMACAGVLKGFLDMYEEKKTMKELMRERYGKYADEPYYGQGVENGYGGTGSVYDGMGGFGCSPHGFFGWEVPCAAAKADLEMLGLVPKKED